MKTITDEVINQPIKVDRLVNPDSRSWSTQTVAFDLGNRRECIRSDTYWQPGVFVLRIRFRVTTTTLGPSIDVRMRDLAEALGIPVWMPILVITTDEGPGTDEEPKMYLAGGPNPDPRWRRPDDEIWEDTEPILAATGATIKT